MLDSFSHMWCAAYRKALSGSPFLLIAVVLVLALWQVSGTVAGPRMEFDDPHRSPFATAANDCTSVDTSTPVAPSAIAPERSSQVHADSSAAAPLYAFSSGLPGDSPFMQIPPTPQDTGKFPRPGFPSDSSRPTFPGDTNRTMFPGWGQRNPQDTSKIRLSPADSMRLAQQDSVRRDSLAQVHRIITDSTWVVYHDSTARLREFTYRRQDPPLVQLFPKISSPLFATGRPTALQRELVVDSTGTNVTARETLNGVDLKVPVTMSLHDYIKEREAYERRKIIADEARRPKQLVAKNDLGELMSKITKIQIPIPQNPIFSIFGKGGISLNISGAVNIKAGFRNTKSDQMTLSRLDQSRNEPDFSQEVQVNVNGMIGDKLNIMADWNTQRQFEYENQLKIKYTGYDDEIVQSVEAGNVSLQTPSAFIGSSQALFGIKAKFQAGPLTLTTLASQKKGQIKQVDVSGGSKEQEFEFRAFEYATNHYFIDLSYQKYYEAYYRDEPPTITPEMQNTQIVEEEVWVQRQGAIPDPNERQGVAFITLPLRGGGYDQSYRSAIDSAGVIETAPFVRLDRSQYELDGDGYLGVLSLNVNVGDQQVVGIAYRTADGTQVGEFARDFPDTTAGKRLILKMVKPRNLISAGPANKLAWQMLLKNIYPIPGIGRNLKKEGFSLDIYRQIPGNEPQNSLQNEPLLRVLGLDKYSGDEGQTANPDGKFDFRPGRTISQTRAEIIFPTLRPFDEGIKKYFADKNVEVSDTALFREVYDTTQTFAQQSPRNRFVIKGKATGEASSRFQLGFNVVEGSVQVLLNGAALVPNVDYTVDYIVGEVVVKNERALVPGANLQIKFEQNDLFQLASKTLLGARGELALGQNTSLGFTIMNLNQETLSDKVRLGEEPNKNTILGVDGATSFDLPFLTRAIDALPILQTREPSQLKVSGEAAYMIPDPNTRKSPIPSDGGEGIAYIDDFEGSRRTIPVGIQFNGWTQSSPPAGPWFANEPDTTKMFAKGKMVWFNRLPTDVSLTEIWPRKAVGNNPANNMATVLDFRYYPKLRGQFNYSTDLTTTLTPNHNWGGVMKPLSVSAINLLKENVNFIELWMRVDKMPSAPTKMVIDLGAVSERVIPGGPNARTASSTTPNSEDLVLGSYPNGTLQEGEDVGLDMRDDNQERAEHQAMIAKDASTNADPSGDDYAFNNATVNTPAEDFSHINGTEGNKDGPSGRIPDTEDLNANGICDQANSYYEYELPLDTIAASNPYIAGGGNKYWYQYRIPINDFKRTVGSPTQENIEFIRVAFINATDTVFVRIADFNLVGNQWQKVVKSAGDSSSVGVVSLEDNPDYDSPPGVIRERDKTKPDDNVLSNEQSLDLILRNVEEGQSAEAARFYTFKALDLFNYKTMKMFVHGDRNFSYISPTNYDAQMYFRFGMDSLNYYEYRAPVHPGWDPLNDVVINFEDLTAIKQRRTDPKVVSDPIPVPGGPPGAEYRVLGNPSLTQVAYLAIGVTNFRKGPSTKKGPLNGEVWFNELRLVSVDDAKGWAYRVDTQLKLADLGSVAFNYQKVDPNFHSLEQRFGSRQLSTNWGLSTSMELARFLPQEWSGTSMPVSYSHTESKVAPKYLPSSDVLVSEAAEQTRQASLARGSSEKQAAADANNVVYQAETRHVTDTYAAPSLRIVFPSQSWLVRDILNRLTLGFNYTKSNDRSPATVYRTAWSWNARIQYAVNLSPDYYFQPFKKLFEGAWFLDEYKDMKIFFAPSSFNWQLSATRSRDRSLQRSLGANEIVSRNFMASRQLGFSWKATEGGLLNLGGDYNLSVESTLLNFELDQNNQQRAFSKIVNDIFFHDRLINFGQDTRYSQRNQFTTKPNIPNIFNIKKFVDFQFGYGVDYAWQNALAKGDLGKSAGFNNSINVGMTIRLKQLFDPLFESKDNEASAGNTQVGMSRGRRSREAGAAGPADSTEATDSTKVTGKPKILEQLKNLLKVFIKTPLLDYDNVSVTFTQTNSAQNSGVVGRPGFVNFWGRVPFFQKSSVWQGPSRMYQLGLISDPSGDLTNFRFDGKPPFFHWDFVPGIRAANGVLINTYRQTNRLTFKTSRALWEGARLDLNWNVGWSYNRTENFQTDSLGRWSRIDPRTGRAPAGYQLTTAGNVDRSFLTMPNVLFLGMFKSNLKEVSRLYSEARSNIADTTSDEEKLGKAFEQGFEALPIFRKIFGQYFPRVNWTLRWDGLEKLPMFQSFVSRLSLDHAYNANYTRQFQNRPGGGGERTDGQHVAYGFAPLVGLNFTFKELAKGSFGASMRYSTNTSYDLTTSSRNIVETFSQEISVSANYTRRGFEIPFFGLSLNNDIDISAAYSVTKNSRTTFDIATLDVDVNGTPLEGSTRTTLEPRIKYVLSSRVTAAIYYRYTKIAPDATGSRIPGTTTNEAGLDVNISIQ